MRLRLAVAASLLFTFCLVEAKSPPAAIIYCINEKARACPNAHSDYSCICEHKDEILYCLATKSPYGNYLEARDHFLGTCIDHIPYLIDDPDYNMQLPQRRSRTPFIASSTTLISSFTSEVAFKPTDNIEIPPPDGDSKEKEKVVDVPEETPTETPVENPEKTPEVPEVPVDIPVDTPEEKPVEIPEEIPDQPQLPEEDINDDNEKFEDDDGCDCDCYCNCDSEFEEDEEGDGEQEEKSPEDGDENNSDNVDNPNEPITENPNDDGVESDDPFNDWDSIDTDDEDEDDDFCHCYCECKCDTDQNDDPTEPVELPENSDETHEFEEIDWDKSTDSEEKDYTKDKHFTCESGDCSLFDIPEDENDNETDSDDMQVFEHLSVEKDEPSLPNQFQYGDLNGANFWEEEKRARNEVMNKFKNQNQEYFESDDDEYAETKNAIDFEFATHDVMFPELNRRDFAQVASSKKYTKMKKKKKLFDENDHRIRFGSSFLKTEKLPKAKPKVDEDCD